MKLPSCSSFPGSSAVAGFAAAPAATTVDEAAIGRATLAETATAAAKAEVATKKAAGMSFARMSHANRTYIL